MAGQTDLGKGVLISGIVAGILGVAASFILLPDVPQGKKYNIGGGSTDHIGKVAETGTHQQLMDKGGIYSHMYSMYTTDRSE